MKKYTYTIIIFLLQFSVVVIAQNRVLISKKEVLVKVKNSNISQKISKTIFKSAKADYKQTNAIFLPNITISHTGMETNNPLMAFGSKLNQEILTQNDFNPVLLNDPDQIQNFVTRIEIQ